MVRVGGTLFVWLRIRCEHTTQCWGDLLSEVIVQWVMRVVSR